MKDNAALTIGLDLTTNEDDPDVFVIDGKKRRKKSASSSSSSSSSSSKVIKEEVVDLTNEKNNGNSKSSGSSSSSSRKRSKVDEDAEFAKAMQEEEDRRYAKQLSSKETKSSRSGSISSSSSSSSSSERESLRLAQKLQEREDLQLAKQLRQQFEGQDGKKPRPAPIHQPSALAAMRYATNQAKQASDAARPWCSEAILQAAVSVVQKCDVIIHFHPERDLIHLTRDVFYRCQYETGSSSGAKDLAQRHATENRMFGNAYLNELANQMVKYGALNLFRERRGDALAKEKNLLCSLLYPSSNHLTHPPPHPHPHPHPLIQGQYGDSFLLLNAAVRSRCTFTDGDSLGHHRPIATFEHCRHVVSTFTTNDLRALASEGGCHEPVVPVSHGRGGYHGGGCGYAPMFPFGGGLPFWGGIMGGATPGGQGQYKEVQIHGPVRLGQDVDALVLHERHKSNPEIRRLAEEFCNVHQVQLLFQDDIGKYGY